MNKQEYIDYCEQVERYLKGVEFVSTGLCSRCAECDLEEGENYEEEPGFSWSSCEICKSGLGGERYTWHGRIDGNIVHGSCCSDCMYFINYGCLDDTTMDEIEEGGTV